MVELPGAEPPPSSDEELRLVTVFVSSNPAALAVAKLALQSGGIRFIVKGEGVQDLIGLGRMFGGMNLATGPVQLQVRSQDTEYARELLSELLS